jgi:hypothetical protein
MIKQCLHSKKGRKRREFAIKEEGVGNCYDCDFDLENNKSCRKFYVITITIIDIEE